MTEKFELKEQFNVKPPIIFDAWLNSEEHSRMTGGKAHCGIKVGDKFSAWNGYIQGRNIKLIANKEIVQSWRTSEFAEDDEDSNLIIRLEEDENGTVLNLIHSNIPKGQTQYKQGWIDHYFVPMKIYFEG